MTTALPVMLLTDFGLLDDFVGVCHGVLLRRSPRSQVVHVTHGIEPQNVAQGAIVLRNTLPYMPEGVHLAVVDPGVGTGRRAIAVRTGAGRFFVGPDNGLLGPAIAASGGAVEAASIESPELILQPLSHTFHGRDVFSPAAGHLAAGGRLSDLGPTLDPSELVQLALPEAQIEGDLLRGQVWSIDRFGNTALSIDGATLRRFLGDSSNVELSVRKDRYFAEVVRTFENVRHGDLMLYVDAYDCVSVAVNKGDVASMFGMRVGDQVGIRPT